MRFIVSGLDKTGKLSEIHSGEDRVAAQAEFEAALSQADLFAVVEIKSGEGADVSKWTNVMRQATHTPKPAVAVVKPETDK